ncbi:MAG: ABC transporter permease [Mycoplasma sp.]|nr:ABC transporter permease [Mycoplasma sp.]
MKKIFKSSAKSFMQSKIAMILLSIVVFISATAFTMLNSSSISFQTSYKKVMSEGKVHDFTIKEKWIINGNPNITIKEDIKKTQERPTVISKTPTEVDFSKNHKNIYLDKIDSTQFALEKTFANNTPNFILDLSEAILSYPKGKNKLSINGIIKIRLFTNGKDKFENIVSTKNPIKDIDENFWTSNLIIDSNVKANSTQKINWKINASTFPGFWEPGKSKVAKITIKKDGKEILEDMANLINNYFVKKVYRAYIFDNSASTGQYKNLINEDDINNLVDSNYPFMFDGDLAAAKKDINIINSLKKINKDIESLLNSRISNIYASKVKKLKMKNGETIDKYIEDPSVVKSLFVGSYKDNKQFKIVSSRFESSSVDNTVVFKGGKPRMAYSDSEMKKGLDNIWNKKPPKSALFNQMGKKHYDKSKQFRWNKEGTLFNNSIKSISFSNFESLQAVVSSSYASEHNLSFMDKNDLQSFRSRYLNASKTKQELFNEYKREGKVITVDSTDYLISGIGTSPDFAFPIINQKNPLPNAKSQAILFTTNLGFKRIKDAFRNNETENYIAFKFNNHASTVIRKEIMQLISKNAQQQMSWPPSISPLTKRNDINERVILAPQRISFLGKIQKSISSISYLTTSMLSIFTFFIIVMVIKKQINSKRKILGTLLANGYTKNQIGLSMVSISFLIIIIPSIFGYITGYFSQQLFVSIFNNYWTLPIVFNSFSFITMFLVIGFPMLTTMIVAFVFTRIELRGELLSIIKESNSKTGGWLTTKINSSLKFVTAKGKITISLFTSNLSKMFMVFVTSTIALLSGSIAFSIIGKFDYAQRKSALPIKYNYKIDLETPTSSSNRYQVSNLENYGLGDKSWIKSIDPDDMYNQKLNDQPYFHWIEDPIKEAAKSKELKYLKHKIQISALLDMEIGASGVITNPWSIAKGAMPDNQLNQAKKDDEAFNKSSYKLISNYNNLGWFKKLNLNDKNIVKRKIEDIKKEKWFKNIENTSKLNQVSKNSKITDTFKDFIFFALKSQIINRLEGFENHLPFMISYGNIVKNKNDELYSQLSFNYNGKTRTGISNTSSRIIGINENKNTMININPKNMEALKNFKMNDLSTPDKETDAIPIIINQYFKEAFGVRVGDTINLEITNHKNKNNANIINRTNAKIIGVDETYNGIKIYSLQKFVNNKLGFDEKHPIFNGVFTKQRIDPTIFKGVNLYSTSNFYVGVSTITESSDLWKKIETVINNKKQWKNSSVNNFQSFIATYSTTPYVLTMSNADWAAMSAYAFKNTLNLTNKMIWMVEGVAVLIAIFFIIIIASMVVEDNKKFIATTKVLGYTKQEIKSMFFRSISLSLALALIVTIPISSAILFGMKYIIMSFGSILVPVAIVWWAIPLSFLILLSAFSIVYRITISRFSNEKMLEAFKA